MQEMGQSNSWWVATWLVRAGVVAALYGAWEQRWGVTGDWKWSAFFLAVALALFGLQSVARRQALGWIIDERGERQKVDSWNGDIPVFTPTTYSQRIVDEAWYRDDRRKNILRWGAGGWSAAGLAYYFWSLHGQPDIAYLGLVIAGMTALFCLGQWYEPFFLELLYLAGWQDMKGAKVLDGRPRQPGLEDVYQQKAHGDARLATEQEARDAAGDATQRPRLHDREF
jgi:hypothetical protein